MMKRALQNLFRKGEGNLTKILCLGVGIAIGLVMLAEVIFERSYDNFIPHLEDTYIIQENYKHQGNDWKNHNTVSGAIAPGIKRYCPEVEAATRFTILNEDLLLTTDDQRTIKGNAYLCDSSFFEVFPRKILMGEAPHTGLEKANNAYISAKLLKVLGNDIIGKQLTWKVFPDFHLTVVGVFEDFPENTHLPKIDIAVALPTIGQIMGDGRNNWLGNDRYSGYIRLRPGTDPQTLEPNIKHMLYTNAPMEELERSGSQFYLNLKPVSKIFLSSEYNRIMNIVFLVFAFIMLAVAVLNYILLVVSSVVKRAKSIATYRCYGAESKDIYRMILAESALHCFIALILAVLIVFGLQDFLQEQMGHSLRALFSPTALVLCLMVVITVTIICGVMPGYIYTRIPVTYAYRRYTENKRQWKLGLLFVQFMLTTFFVCLLTVIGLQYQALTNYRTGFEYKNILYTSLSGTQNIERERCIQELKRLPNVNGVTWGYQEMFMKCSGNNVYDPQNDKEYMNIADMYDVGPDYHKVFSIPILEGTGFTTELGDSVSQEVMVSRSFIDKMEKLAGWTGSPIGKQVFITEHQGRPYTICGVYEEIHLGSQVAEDFDDRPTVMFYNTHPNHLLYIRLKEMGPEQIKEVQDIVSRTMPSQEKHVYSLDLEMANQYNMLLHVRNSILFVGLCILVIALIGLIAYIRDEVNRRRSEIAIRIIHGAQVKDVQLIFLKDILKIAIPAVLIGTAFALFASNRLLELFAFKINLTGYIFGGCILVVLIIMLILSTSMIWKAARSNPINNLRTE
ncbi:FtsX-like permease family protein [Phocaeicola sp.]|uniref:ABC transporter permease n=1 Tax=Phocaeicola sp. TaxID=2773926 RepID=UPI003AB48379